MQFLYSLLLIATFFTSLQAMEAEEMVQATQKALTAEQAAELAKQDAQMRYLESSLRMSLDGIPNPEILQSYLKSGVKPDSSHLSAAFDSPYVGPKTLLVINQLLVAGAQITPKFLKDVLKSDKPESLKVFEMLLEKGGNTFIDKDASFNKEITKANNIVRWSKTITPETRDLLQKKLQFYESVAARERATRPAAPAKIKGIYEPNLPTPIALIPRELKQLILNQLTTNDSLPEISLSIVRARRTNKTFNTLLNDATFTKTLIKQLAQGPAQKFIESNFSNMEASSKAEASLITAAATINTPASIELLKNYLKKEYRKDFATTLLEKAAATGNNGIIDSLLKAGIKADERGYHSPAIVTAASNNNLSGVKILLNAGADADSALPQAISNHASSDSIKALLTKAKLDRYQGNADETLLMQALALGPNSNVETVRALLDRGVKINHKSSIRGYQNPVTALDVALEKEQTKGLDPAIIALLRARGAKRAAELKE